MSAAKPEVGLVRDWCQSAGPWGRSGARPAAAYGPPCSGRGGVEMSRATACRGTAFQRCRRPVYCGLSRRPSPCRAGPGQIAVPWDGTAMRGGRAALVPHWGQRFLARRGSACLFPEMRRLRCRRSGPARGGAFRRYSTFSRLLYCFSFPSLCGAKGVRSRLTPWCRSGARPAAAMGRFVPGGA